MKTSKDNNGKVMVVDDTPANLKLLTGILQDVGYEPRAFPSGKLAIQAALAEAPDLFLLDINMPDMNGYEICERLKAVDSLREIPVIFISALNEETDKVRAFEVGGVDYVTKPFQFEEVLARVKTHLDLRHARLTIKRHNTRLQEIVNQQVSEILQVQRQMTAAQMQTIVAMSKIAEARDDDTGKHIEKTQTYCRILATKLMDAPEYQEQIDDNFCNDIYHASPLHDIGKVAIADAILLKPGKLTKDEFEEMKRHTVIGARNLESVREKHPDNSFVNIGIRIARSHHERWDGSGYPDGLAGDEIPLVAQIMAVADVYDALRSKRVYKPAFSHEKSRGIITDGIGTHFSPGAGKAFVEFEEEFAGIAEELGDR